MKHLILTSTLVLGMLVGTTNIYADQQESKVDFNKVQYSTYNNSAEIAIDTTFNNTINDWTGYKIDVFVRANANNVIKSGDTIKIKMPQSNFISYENARFGGNLSSGESSSPYFTANYSKTDNSYVITFDKDIDHYQALNIQITLPSSRNNISYTSDQTTIGQVTATYNETSLNIPNNAITVSQAYINFNDSIQLGHGFPTEAKEGLPTDLDNYDQGDYYIPYKKQFTFSGFINGNGNSTATNVTYKFVSNNNFTKNVINADSFRISTNQGLSSNHTTYVALNGYKGATVIQQSDGSVDITIPNMADFKASRFIFTTTPDNFNNGATAQSQIQVFSNDNLLAYLNAAMHQQ